MAKPDMKTQIFLDSGDPEDTKEMLASLGYLDGQTTNPSLVAKKLRADNPDLKLTEAELLDAYKDIVRQIQELNPGKSVSVEVYGDSETKAEAMIAQGKQMYEWIPTAHVKLPTTAEGLKAAEALVAEGIRVNMTLVFTQQQAAAVYAATKGAKKGDVFLSPFIGRLDDKGQNGMDLIKNILKMYEAGDGHVEVLTASVRSFEHFLGAVALGTDIMTCPKKILVEWAEKDMMLPGADYAYERPELAAMPYEDVSLDLPWSEYDLHHDLTDAGLQRFADDWNNLLG